MRGLLQLSVYTLVGFLGAGVNFLLMPYLSHFLMPGDYGVLAMFNSYVTILIPLIGLVASGITSLEYYKLKDKKEFAVLFSSIQVIPILPALFILLINLFFPDQIATLLEIPPNKTYWLGLSVIIALLSIYVETLLGYTIAEQKSKIYALFNISKLAIEVSLTLWFVTGMKMSWEGRLLAWLITNNIYLFIAFAYFNKRGLLTTQISKKYILYGVTFGLPLILHTLGKFVINQSDRIFIAKMVSIEDAGIYNIGYQVGMIMLVIVNAIGNFIYPFIIERLENPNPENKKQIIRSICAVIGLSSLCLMIITLVTPALLLWFVDKKYEQATQYVFWIALSYYFWGIYLIFSGFIFYTKKNGFLAWLSIFNIVLNGVLNYLLIQRHGAIGAAYATCISFFIIALLVVFKSLKLYGLPWNYPIKAIFYNLK